MAETVFNFAKKHLADYTIRLTTADGAAATSLYLLLISTEYVAASSWMDQDYLLTATTTDCIAHFEVTSGHMSSIARQSIGATTATEDDSGNTAWMLGSTAITFSAVSSGINAAGKVGGAIIFAEIAAADSSGRVPIALYDTNFPVTANGGDITVNFSTGGWLQYTT